MQDAGPEGLPVRGLHLEGLVLGVEESEGVLTGQTEHVLRLEVAPGGLHVVAGRVEPAGPQPEVLRVLEEVVSQILHYR